MKYVGAIKGSVVALIIFAIIAIFVPGYGVSEDVLIIVTVSTFIFAILVGYFLSGNYQKFVNIQSSAIQEDAFFLSFYKTAQINGEKFSGKIRELIDKYYISVYDSYGSKEYPYKVNRAYFLEMWDAVRKLKPIKNSMAFSWMLEELTNIEANRNAASSKSRSKMGLGNWTVLIVLASIILFCIFYLRVDALYSQIISVLLSTTLILVLLKIRDLQNLKGSGGGIVPESGQELFEAMGKPRYYNQYLIKKGWYKVPKNVTEYRLGLHEPGEKPKIKLIKI